MRDLSGPVRILAACSALLGACLVGPAVLGQPAPPAATRPGVTEVSPTLQAQLQPAEDPPPARASFSLQAPSTVEAGSRFAITIARDRRDGRTYDFTLRFEPSGLVADAPERVIVADEQPNGTARITTLADPPGDGPHRLRVFLVPGKSQPNISARAIDITVTEPIPDPPRFSLQGPSTVAAGRAFHVTIARDRSDGKAYGFRLQFDPAGLIVDPPDELTLFDDPGNATVRLTTRADPPGDGPHRLRIALVPGANGPRVVAPRAVEVSVTEPVPAARFSLRAPPEVEAGEPIAVEVVGDRNDRRTHDFRLRFDPPDLVAEPPGRVTVAANQRSGTVIVATRDDPPGSGPHALRITLLPGESEPVIGAPRALEVTVNEPPPSRFTLRAPADVSAGERIAIEIVRDRTDGRSHTLQLSYEPAGLVDDPPLRAVLGADDDRWQAEIATAADPPGDGPHVLRIALGPGEGSASVIVRESPAPPIPPTDGPGPTYLVRAPDGGVPRGEAIVFTVTREGGTGQTQIPYEAFQAGHLVASDELVFEEDGPQSVTVSGYDLCLEGPWLALQGVPGEGARAQVMLAGDPPGACAGPRWPWWAIPLVLVPIGLLALALREWRRRKRIAYLNLWSRCEVDPGEPVPQDSQPGLRGPVFAVRFHVLAGEADGPDPQPLRETADV